MMVRWLIQEKLRMSTIAAMLFGLVASSVSSLSAAGPSAARSDEAGWRSCINKSVREVVIAALNENNEAALYRGDKQIVDRAMWGCLPPTSMLLGDARAQSDAWTRAAAGVKAQIRNDAPRVKAEKADEDRASAVYVLCLRNSAKLLALGSDESADLIVRAAFPACSVERNAVFDTYRRYEDIFEPSAMQVMEKVYFDRLLLEVIATRANRLRRLALCLDGTCARYIPTGWGLRVEIIPPAAPTAKPKPSEGGETPASEGNNAPREQAFSSFPIS
jgi:hypothetical protein